MNENPSADQAWVRVATGLSRDALLTFCRDVERLLRINSMYEFEEWRPESENRFFMSIYNLSNGRRLATSISVEPLLDGVRIAYATGLKTATEFRVEQPIASAAQEATSETQGAILVVTDDYSGAPEEERQTRADEIDKSLVWWGHDLHRYLRHWARWSRFGWWRWYMRQVWQPMKPKARRITFMLIAITVFEFVVGVLAVAGFSLYPG